MNNKLFLLTVIGASLGASCAGAATKPGPKPKTNAKVAKPPAKKSAAKPAGKPAAKPTPKPAPKPTAPPAPAGPLYQNNLEKIAPGKLPPEFLVLGGEFVVAKDEKNTFIELPGEPIDAFGLLFGPALKEEGVTAQLRAFGTKKGRRVPAFGVGVFGVAGYKARLSPAAGKLEILKDEEIKASVAAEWTSESWTWVKIQAQPLDKKQWKVQAKAWPDGSPEPEAWQVEWTDSEAPPSGRAMLLGAPYAGTPLHFDDLFMNKAK